MAPPRPVKAVIGVVGLTASGKSEWALQVAQHLGGEIISADSRQVYRRLEIGTAKPTEAMRRQVPHHCLDLVEPTQHYSLAEYLRAARAAMAEIQEQGRKVIIVGGSGQYVWALLEGWVVPPAPPDPALRAELQRQADQHGAAWLHAELAQFDAAAAEVIEVNNTRRVIRALEVYRKTGVPISEWQRRREPIAFYAIAPQMSDDELHQRIARRTRAMFEAGLVDEVRELLASGVPASAPGFNAIGYRSVLAYLRGELDAGEAEAAVAQQTRRFAKQQRQWFRANDRRIAWVPSFEALRLHEWPRHAPFDGHE